MDIKLCVYCDFCQETTTVAVDYDDSIVEVLARLGFGSVDNEICCEKCEEKVQHQDFYSFADRIAIERNYNE